MTPEALDRFLEKCVHDSLLTDINALKPGNVSRYADGHDMQVDDFIKSAALSTPVLCDRRRSVGQRILDSVQATRDAVGCNTNLGLILLIAPLVFAMQQQNPGETLRQSLAEILLDIDVVESGKIFQAICLAAPGGLGQSRQYDVHLHPEVTITEAMRASMDRDRIAYQYVSQYNDIFGLGLETIRTADRRWSSIEWATVACYLTFLNEFHDSHVQRKFGSAIAQDVQARAQGIMQQFMSCTEPGAMVETLLAFDRELKLEGINPGTTADLSVTSVLLYRMLQA